MDNLSNSDDTIILAEGLEGSIYPFDAPKTHLSAYFEGRIAV